MEYAKHGMGTEAPYSHPEKGTSMDQFKDMVTRFIENKIGKGDHKNFVNRIMDVADANHDQKVCLFLVSLVMLFIVEKTTNYSICFFGGG